MNIIEFGEALLKTKDLDPMYIAVADADLPLAQKYRLLLAYACLYHLGAACRLSEYKGKDFWHWLMTAAVNEGLQWPRGAERRHWRGSQAVASAQDLTDHFRLPEYAFEYWSGGGDHMTFSGVSTRVKKSLGFGDWVSFKIADIAERVLGYPVDFTDCELGIYADPRKGAALAGFCDMSYPITDAEMKLVCDGYVREFSRFKAPPHGDRKCNIQEVETIFCKYKSHVNGQYRVGKDTREIRHGLGGWGKTASEVRDCLPKEPK